MLRHFKCDGVKSVDVRGGECFITFSTVDQAKEVITKLDKKRVEVSKDDNGVIFFTEVFGEEEGRKLMASPAKKGGLKAKVKVVKDDDEKYGGGMNRGRFGGSPRASPPQRMDSFGSGGGPGGELAYGPSGDRRSAAPPQRGQNFGDDRSNAQGPSTVPALTPLQRDSSGSR
ncbi:hypothetical protein TL16_g03076 [Triparma laevis f. inornata]|uniref:RRM domain-containing protein n=1 Tax=Triparma laevis f. inornata TaxID=1714386 RepID=A0A9W6ZU80_9STRA|nr:hypothetical protein TL16_g03076 [Triparma laevis f. inornata]